jgi:drug/metabolite transporter (DMT)-like permease
MQGLGTVIIVAGVIVLSMSGQENDIGTGGPVATETPTVAILFAIGAAICFGTRSLILKYMGIVLGIDGISASVMFLGVDGFTGGLIGVIATSTGGGFADLPREIILIGILSGIFAGIGVFNLNVAISIGSPGPAFAIANTVCVFQSMADWVFQGQVPTPP